MNNNILRTFSLTFLLGMFLLIIASPGVSGAWNRTLNENLNLYYDFNSSSEMIGGINLVNLDGTPSYNASNCIMGNCSQLSIDNNFRIPASTYTNLGASSDKSFNGWFRIANGAATEPTLLCRNPGLSNPFFQVGDNINRIFYFSDTMTGTIYKTPWDMTNNNWYMITYTRNSSGWGKIYINGSLMTQGQSISLIDGSLAVDLGSQNGGQDMAGQIDEMGWWGRILAPSEVLQLYNSAGSLAYISYPDIVSVHNLAYNNPVLEATYQSFSGNLTYNSSYYTSIISASLVYNNTVYPAIVSGGSGETSISASLVVPVVSTATSKNFYFQVLFNNQTTDIQYNSSILTQVISDIALDDCTSYTNQSFNISLYDEETKAFINATYPNNATIEVDMEIYYQNSLIANFSKKFNNTNPVRICSLTNNLNSSEIYVSASIRYESDSRVSEFYNIQLDSLNGVALPVQIGLYDLKTSDSTAFKINYVDENYNPVENAIIEIKRKYVGDGLFRSVEIPITDSYGNTIGHFDIDNVIYSIYVYKDGELLSTFENVVVQCQNALYSECNLNLNAVSQITYFTDWFNVNNISYSYLDSLSSTRTLSLSITSLSSLSRNFTWFVRKYANYQNETICANSITSTSSIFSCVIPSSYGNLTLISEIYVDGELIDTSFFSIFQDTRELFGSTGVIFASIIFMLLAMMMLSSHIGMLIFGLIGIVFAGILFLLDNGNLIGVGSAMVGLVIAISIIIWKINKVEGGR